MNGKKWQGRSKVSSRARHVSSVNEILVATTCCWAPCYRLVKDQTGLRRSTEGGSMVGSDRLNVPEVNRGEWGAGAVRVLQEKAGPFQTEQAKPIRGVPLDPYVHDVCTATDPTTLLGDGCSEPMIKHVRKMRIWHVLTCAFICLDHRPGVAYHPQHRRRPKVPVPLWPAGIVEAERIECVEMWRIFDNPRTAHLPAPVPTAHPHLHRYTGRPLMTILLQ